MPITISNSEQQSFGSLRGVTATLTFDNSYAAGPGEPLTPAQIGLGEITAIQFNQVEDGYSFHYDIANEVVIVYQPDGADAVQREVTGAVDLSGVVVEIVAYGR